MMSQNQKPQLRSKAVAMSIANTAEYALRKVKDKREYEAVSGEFTKYTGSILPNVETRRDLKFRSVGAPIMATPGVKALHLSFTGKVSYNQSNELKTITEQSSWANWSIKPAGMEDADWARLKRYSTPMVLLDVELWLAGEGPPAPLRTHTHSELDVDWTANAPQVRVNVDKYAQEFSSAKHLGTDGANTSAVILEGLAFALGARSFEITSELVLPIVEFESISSYIVPVITMHIGGRTMGAAGIDAAFDFNGRAYYMD